MNLSEEQIKTILKSTQIKLGYQSQWEDAIVDEIEQLQSYDQLIERSKRKARISLWASLCTTVCLIVALFYSLLISNSPQTSKGLQNLLPTLMVVMMLFMLHQLLFFSQSLQEKVKT